MTILQQVIPAASAIAGRVSASQELPYMTPPIVQPQQHFSGDSQDSSSKSNSRPLLMKIEEEEKHRQITTKNFPLTYRRIHEYKCS